ncbi:hypothetical protein SpCBS45565_g05794 [Spizellomyces sp. 'palustris']|nr:hypothetical protein SpCBS45565_g05794 [Spizellomyces sp. 'palustris']
MSYGEIPLWDSRVDEEPFTPPVPKKTTLEILPEEFRRALSPERFIVDETYSPHDEEANAAFDEWVGSDGTQRLLNTEESYWGHTDQQSSAETLVGSTEASSKTGGQPGGKPDSHFLRPVFRKVVAGAACLLLLALGVGVWAVTKRGAETSSSSATTVSSADAYARTIILISLDGFRASYLNRNLTPTLAQIAADGIHAKTMQPVFPSITFPNHYSIVTGMYPESHGIVANVFYDPEKDDTFVYVDPASNGNGQWWGGEPIWVTAIKQSHRSASCMWPGSEAPIQDIRPTYWFKYNHTMPLFDRAEKILEWLEKPLEERPSVITMYIPDVDSAGHWAGVDSKEVNDSLVRVDQALEHLLQGLEERNLTGKVNLMVVSDHGMTNSSSNRVIFLDDYINLNDVTILENKPLVMLYPNEGNATDGILKALSKGSEENGRFRVWRREDAPLEYHYSHSSRIGPIVAIPENGWVFAARSTHDPTKPFQPIGLHGYNITHPDMQSIFIASGPAFRPAKEPLPTFLNLELYNLMCRIMDLAPAPNNGTRVWMEEFEKRWLAPGL